MQGLPIGWRLKKPVPEVIWGVYLLIAASQWDRHNTQKQIDAAYTIAKKLLDARPVR